MHQQYNQYIKHALLLLFAGIGLLYLYTIVSFLVVNHIRGDEFLSFLHSSPTAFSFTEVLGNIKNGSDHSYLHSGLLWLWFKCFGHSIEVQRSLSLLCWLLSFFLLIRILTSIIPHVLWRWLIGGITLFSNMGIFLATDGRFYSLVLLVSLMQLYAWFQAAKKDKPISWWLVAVMQLTALLTSPLLFFFQVFLFLGFYFMYLRYRKPIFLQQAVQGLLGMVLATLVYFLFFKINLMHEHFTTKYALNHFSFQFPPATDFFELPFRWLLVPDFPGLSNQVDGLLFVLMILIVWLCGRSVFTLHLKAAPLLQKWVLVSATFLVLGLGLHVLLYVLFAIPAWPNRYYAMVFFVLPIAASMLMLYSVAEKYRYLMVLLISLFMLNRAYTEKEKISERKAALMNMNEQTADLRNSNCKGVFIERFASNYEEFAVFGEWYIRFPELRNRLYYLYTKQDAERSAYFENLKQSGYQEVMLIAPNEVYKEFHTHKPCYIMARKDDKRFNPQNYPNLIQVNR